MGNLYSQEEREEALKLADEIGTAAAVRRLGINVDTLYGWRGRRKNVKANLNYRITCSIPPKIIVFNEVYRQKR